MKNFTVKKYFAFLFLISIYWSLFGIEGYQSFSLLIIPIFGFPYFGFNYYNKLSKLSSILKKDYPEIFRINKSNYGYFKDELINTTLLFGSEDFKNVHDEEVLELLNQTKLSLKLSLLTIVSPVIIIFIVGVFR
jgi:hypothetical protein